MERQQRIMKFQDWGSGVAQHFLMNLAKVYILVLTKRTLCQGFVAFIATRSIPDALPNLYISFMFSLPFGTSVPNPASSSLQG